MTEQNLAYQMFLAEQNLEQAKLESFIKECVLISESKNTIDNMVVIQESFAEKVKATVKKFLAMISKMWAKFMEAMTTLIRRDKVYLEKYKDIILKKRPIEANYTMYNYNIQALLSDSCPVLNLNEMDNILKDNDTFITSKFNSYISGAKTPYDMNALTKAKLRNGAEQSVKSTQLNMTDLYNYCIDYKKLEDVIKKDLTNINKVSLDVMNKIDELVRNNQIKKESSFFNDREYFSMVYESYIHEEEKPKNPADGIKDNRQQPQQQPVNRDVTGGKAVKDTTTDNNSNVPSQNYQKTGEQNQTGEINTEKTAKELSDKANVYLKVCGDFVSAKQTIAEEIYKTYMSIIRAHVRDHVGVKDPANNKVKDQASDLNNNNQQSEEEKPTNNNDHIIDLDSPKSKLNSVIDKAKQKGAEAAQKVADKLRK